MSQQPEHVRRHLWGTWRTANALRSTPLRSPEGRSTRRKWDVLANRMPSLWVFNTRKQTPTKANKHLSRGMKRLAWYVVAAQAGIQHANTRQPPLTHPSVRGARAHKPSFDAHDTFKHHKKRRHQARPSMPR
ncbi:hypothetical protein BUALT_Bualt19G0006500 [Buddleja alternifolia]|uniref:Uncharacterized protein n=1 Tax=Buddleja alternifolia TaxID=168488 RepID=A0AAV6W1L5_9LAMI|nr:hypothetical protein BUALT_Bualt19G0006500 [Buddleja alternifolia]